MEENGVRPKKQVLHTFYSYSYNEPDLKSAARLQF